MAVQCRCGHNAEVHTTNAPDPFCMSCEPEWPGDTGWCHRFNPAPIDTDPVGRPGQQQGARHWPKSDGQ